MDFQFTHEQRLWGDTVHSFMDKEVGREYTREHDANREFPEEVFKKMARHGWLGLLVDEQDGGSAADPIMFALFCEAIGKFSLDTAACIMTSMFTATNISRHGTAEQKRRYLAPFLAGDAKFSISISEPHAGSDAAAVRSTAVLDGDHWVLNGNKVWCSGAHLPNATIAILARTGPGRHDGFSVFLVPNTTAGLKIKKMNTIVRKSLGTTEFFMDNLRIPKDALLGEVGKGWQYIGEHRRVAGRQRPNRARRYDSVYQGSQAIWGSARFLSGAQAPHGRERNRAGGGSSVGLLGGLQDGPGRACGQRGVDGETVLLAGSVQNS